MVIHQEEIRQEVINQEDFLLMVFTVTIKKVNIGENMMEKMMAYNAWRKEKRVHLAGLSMADRLELTWQRRREIFGNDADVIWEDELKNESVYRALDDLDSGDYYPDGVHYNIDGHKLLAERIMNMIKEREKG